MHQQPLTPTNRPAPRRWGTHWTAVVLAGVLALSVGQSAQAATDQTRPWLPVVEQGKLAPTPQADKLGQHDRQLLAQAQRAGRRSVTVLVATQDGGAAAAAQTLDTLGARVTYRNDGLGYVRAQVPVRAVEKAAQVREIVGMDVNEKLRVPQIRPDSPHLRRYRLATGQAVGSPSSIAPPGPDATTGVNNPYLPISEVGATRLVAENPTYDGRSVTIGVLDSGIDVDHPALQVTTTGQRKIVDWVSATDPLTDADPLWRRMSQLISGPSDSYDQQTWKLPLGDYLISSLAERESEASEFAGDYNRDGDTTDTWGILYDKARQTVWVDTNRNHSFLDDKPMQPYSVAYDTGHLGFDRAKTALNEAVPFTVQIKPNVSLEPLGQEGTADFVNIGLVSYSHGTHVAGIAAANHLFGGAMTGAAPGARLVSAQACTVDGTCSASALVEGMIDLVTARHVDVVNLSIGGLPALNDGVNARAEIYNRLIDDYGVQIFTSAGNDGPGLNTSADPGVASKVISVGATISQATWWANYGSRVSAPRALFPFSARGPAEDGALKPDLTAPGAAISTTPQWLQGLAVPEAGYELPPGYAMSNGTSMASPMAAGVAALVLSASWANEIPVTAAQLRKALLSSASFSPLMSPSEQGAGQIVAPRAWRYLRFDEALQPWDYTVQAPVCTALSRFLATPHQGVGLYDRCPPGQVDPTQGQARSYTLTLTRTSGPDEPREHLLRIRGNQTAFTVAPSVLLPLNQPVEVAVQVATPQAGEYSAALELDDPGNPGLERLIALQVVVGQQFSAADYQWQEAGSVQRSRTRSYFLTVPPGARTLQVSLTGLAAGSQTRFTAFHPYGLPVDSTESRDCYAHYSDPQTCHPLRRTYAEPTPGIWQISVEARRTTHTLRNPYLLQARVNGVQAFPQPLQVQAVRVGQPKRLIWSLSNQFAPVTITAVGGPLGSAHREKPTLTTGQMLSYTVTVPEHTATLRACLSNPSDAGADLDLIVLRGSQEIATSAGGDSSEAVEIPNPPPGTYTVIIVGYEVPSGSTTIDYMDLYTTSALGWLDVSSVPLTLPDATPAPLRGELMAGLVPGSGRQLLGEVQLLSSDQQLVGTATVTVDDVLPAAD